MNLAVHRGRHGLPHDSDVFAMIGRPLDYSRIWRCCHRLAYASGSRAIRGPDGRSGRCPLPVIGPAVSQRSAAVIAAMLRSAQLDPLILEPSSRPSSPVCSPSPDVSILPRVRGALSTRSTPMHLCAVGAHDQLGWHRSPLRCGRPLVGGAHSAAHAPAQRTSTPLSAGRRP